MWMVPFHAGCQRLLTTTRPDFNVQASALLTAGVVNVVYGVVLAVWVVLSLPRTGLDAICGILFVALAVNAMAFFYFQFLNMSLTSIHMSILLRVFWAGEISKAQLVTKYSDQQMVEERLRRLSQLKQIEVRDGLVRLRSSTMIVLAVPIYVWRRILGFSR